MRRLVHALLTGTPELTALIPAARWKEGSGVDASPKRPFAVIRMSDASRTVSGGKQRVAEIWIHDNRGSYTTIDRIQGILKEIMENAPQMENDTERIVHVRWDSDSPDLIDDGYDTATKWSRFVLTGRK